VSLVQKTPFTEERGQKQTLSIFACEVRSLSLERIFAGKSILNQGASLIHAKREIMLFQPLISVPASRCRIRLGNRPRRKLIVNNITDFVNRNNFRAKKMLYPFPYTKIVFGDDMAGCIVKNAEGKIICAIADNPERLVSYYYFYCAHGFDINKAKRRRNSIQILAGGIITQF